MCAFDSLPLLRGHSFDDDTKKWPGGAIKYHRAFTREEEDHYTRRKLVTGRGLRGHRRCCAGCLRHHRRRCCAERAHSEEPPEPNSAPDSAEPYAHYIQ